MSLVRIGNSDSWAGTYIVIRYEGFSASGATRVWVVAAKDGAAAGSDIGRVKWFARWRRYSFFPWPETVFEQDCLREIAQFLVDRTAEHRRQ